MSAKMTFLFLLMAVLYSTAASAQLGQGWVEYEPVKKIHLVDFNYKDNPKGMYSFEWKSKAEVGTPTWNICVGRDSMVSRRTRWRGLQTTVPQYAHRYD